MKKLIATVLVLALVLAFASQAMGLVVSTPATAKKPPLYINKLVISDPFLNPFDVKNWAGAQAATAYPAGSQIWFVAEIVVAGEGDTDAAYMWDGVNKPTGAAWGWDADGATLSFTGKDNCLSFSGSTWATFAVISGMNVSTASVSNRGDVVSALDNKVEFYLSTIDPRNNAGVVALENSGLVFKDNTLSLSMLELAFVAGEGKTGDVNNFGQLLGTGAVGVYKATNPKAYYLHFMATTKAATEGVCIGTLTIGGGSGKFLTDQAQPDRLWQAGDKDTLLRTAVISSPTTIANFTNDTNITSIIFSDRSEIYDLFNTVNGKAYTIMKINNEGGPYGGGVMYVLMNGDNDKNVISFVVKDDIFRGLAKYRSDTGCKAFNVNTSGRVGSNYDAVASNDLSNSFVAAQYASLRSTGEAIPKAELQQIFDFFGFAYANPVAPADGHFLKSSGFTSVAEAKYNVATAVVPTPDIVVPIPTTGDAASSTGLILAVSAILAAAAAGFVLSKRARV